MQSNSFLPNRYRGILSHGMPALSFPRQAMIGAILVLALIAFEMFNFDSTRYALESLIGGVTFLGLSWAVILAIAFCAIDFAGLARIFTPEQGLDEPKEIWYLTGAWFLGATMNAIMTWWAVSLVLLNHNFGNEVLARQQLLEYVPIFVAVLVWLTRILFIGAFSVAGDHLYKSYSASKAAPRQSVGSRQSMPAGTPKRNVIPAAPMAAAGAAGEGTPHNQAPRGRPQRPVSSGRNQAVPVNASPQRRR